MTEQFSAKQVVWEIPFEKREGKEGLCFAWPKIYMYTYIFLLMLLTVHPLQMYLGRKFVLKHPACGYKLPMTAQRSLIPHWCFSLVSDDTQSLRFSTCQTTSSWLFRLGRSQRYNIFCQGWKQRAAYVVILNILTNRDLESHDTVFMESGRFKKKCIAQSTLYFL